LSDFQWPHRQDRNQALAAEAQHAWEEKARAEAEAWEKRLDGEGGGASQAEGK
jgi:hypothetical protein